MAKTPRQLAVKKLDDMFSMYIRLRKADMFGNAVCVTCGKTDNWKKMQCGHYYSRGKMGTRWDDRNCHVQCAGCNVFKHGNYIAYTKYMARLYDQATLDQLEMRADSSPRFTVAELNLMITELDKRLQLLTR